VDQPESRSALVEGIQTASKLTTVGLVFAMPALVGFGLDRLWGTLPAATIVGALLGIVLGMLRVLAIARELPASSSRRSKPPGGDPRDAGSETGGDAT
jgi:F0F1-type ATP synthase assembly protein I